jgi:hypothetical protein
MNKLYLFMAIWGYSTVVAAQAPTDLPDMANARMLGRKFSEQILQNRDFSHFPSGYFASRLSLFPFWLKELLEEEITKANLSTAERNEIGVPLFNLMCVMALSSSKAALEDDLRIEKVFPKKVIQLINRQPILSRLLQDELIFGNVSQLKSFSQALPRVTIAMQKYLNEHPENWKPYFPKYAASSNSSHSEGYKGHCHGEDCFEYPEGTEVFTVSAFPFFLFLTKEREEFKIIAIEMMTF